MTPTRRTMETLRLFALAAMLCTLEGAARAEDTERVSPGCFRKGYKVTCRSWSSADAPALPSVFSRRDFMVLDLSSMDAAKKIDMLGRGASCDKQRALGLPPQGLGAVLPQGRLPARWFSSRYDTLYVLYIRGAGLRDVHPDAFEMLTALQHVYLGSNLLQRLSPDLWRHNEHLSGVSLENNLALKIAEDEPLFRSDTVEYLDLSGCGLRSLPADAFSELPRLQTLRLERNCLRTVPAAALAGLEDLWAVALADNAIHDLSVEDARLLARLPDATLHGNPWRCDCTLRDTLHTLDGDARVFWNQSTLDLVCLWPPEDVERPWAEVLSRDECREYDTLDNAIPSISARPPLSPAKPQPQAVGDACGRCGGGGDANYCKWTAIAALVLLVLGVLLLVLAAFTDRLAITVSVAGARRKATRSVSRANLTHSADNGVYLHDEINDLGQREADDRRFVVHFGRGS